MSTTLNDEQLNKAALLIAKLLLRTREGKIQWHSESETLSGMIGFGNRRYSATLEDGIEAILIRDEKQLAFLLSGPPVEGVLPAGHFSWTQAFLGKNQNEILSLPLEHSYANGDNLSPESTVYRDLQELFYLAENPKSVSDDLRYQQALTFLDKLSA
jgi:hypothetical protein